jgi:hypothetical protein
MWLSIKLSQKTSNHKKEILSVKFLDNLPFGRALSETAVFFLKFSNYHT